MRCKIEATREPGIESLCAAIVKRAIMDYERSLRHVAANSPKEGERFWIEEAQREECERFFLGTWFSTICDLDGPRLVERIKKEAV